MTIVIKGHSYDYEIKNVAMLFFWGEKLELSSVTPESGDYLLTELSEREAQAVLTVHLSLNGSSYNETCGISLDHSEFDKESERLFGVMIYKLLSAVTGITPRWGILTGIRPVTIARKLMAGGMSDTQLHEYFTDKYLVSEQKTNLLIKTAHMENTIVSLSKPDSFSLYISIPFCPTRCFYCSFVSHATEKSAKLMDEYLVKLCDELRYTGEIAEKLGLRLETVYIGGGTPTTLSAQGLITLFSAVRESFDLSAIREYTIEAGRPDTITSDKLKAIKNSEVTRISINPQTLNDDVLELIGRRHTTKQLYDSFALARDEGIDNINMDLIAGLPTDTLESFIHSVNGCIELSPENITVHTLAVKRSSNMVYQNAADFDAHDGIVSKMVDYATDALTEAGYTPYYLYRQRNTRENLENVGFCKSGTEGLYNVYIMDETHTILACGAGATTKLRQPLGNRIERIFNYKYPYEYIRDFDEIKKRKDRVVGFYDTQHT